MTYQDIVNVIRNAAGSVNPLGSFVHGRKSDGSLEYNSAFPQIILLEPQPNPNNSNKEFLETISFPIIFVGQDTPESTNEEREDIKEAMFILSRDLLKELETEDLIQFGFSSAQPEIRQLAATATGFSYTLNATYSYLVDCDGPDVLPPTVFIGASDTDVTVGSQVELIWVAYNVDSVSIDNGVGNVARFGRTFVTVNADTTFTASVSNSAGSDTASVTIQISAGCLDVEVENTDLSYTATVASGGTLVLPDTNYNVYVNGVLDQSFTNPTLEPTLNINIT